MKITEEYISVSGSDDMPALISLTEKNVRNGSSIAIEKIPY